MSNHAVKKNGQCHDDCTACHVERLEHRIDAYEAGREFDGEKIARLQGVVLKQQAVVDAAKTKCREIMAGGTTDPVIGAAEYRTAGEIFLVLGGNIMRNNTFVVDGEP